MAYNKEGQSLLGYQATAPINYHAAPSYTMDADGSHAVAVGAPAAQPSAPQAQPQSHSQPQGSAKFGVFNDDELYSLKQEVVDVSFEEAFVETTVGKESPCNEVMLKVNRAIYTITRDVFYFIFVITFGWALAIFFAVFMALTGFFITYVVSPMVKMTFLGSRIPMRAWRFMVRAMVDPCFESFSRGLANVHVNLNHNKTVSGSINKNSQDISV